MFQVRIHGRGGQGVVTAAEMLSVVNAFVVRPFFTEITFSYSLVGEPVIFIIVGLGVAFLVFSIIVPIYNLASVIK